MPCAQTSTCRSSRSAASCLFVTFCWPLAGGSNSCYWGLFGWAPVRIGVNSLSSVSGLVLDFEGRVFALPRASLCFDIEAYCPGLRCFRCHGHQCQLIFEVWVPTRQSVRPPDLWPSEARTPPPPSRARICATRVAFLCAFPNPVKPRRQARVSLEIVTSLSQARILYCSSNLVKVIWACPVPF